MAADAAGGIATRGTVSLTLKVEFAGSLGALAFEAYFLPDTRSQAQGDQDRHGVSVLYSLNLTRSINGKSVPFKG